MEDNAYPARLAGALLDLPENYGYTPESPRRQAFLLRQEIYNREMQVHSGEPMVVRLAHCLSAYLMEKEIVFEDDRLAGFYLFTGNTYINRPANVVEEVGFARQDCPDLDPQAFQELNELVKYVEQGMCTRCPCGHVIAGYEKVLAVGIGGLTAETEAAIVEQGETPFRKAALIVCRAAANIIQRYGKEAEQLAHESAGSARLHYTRVATACQWVAVKPPRDFFEAVQLLCLVHEIIITEQRSGSLSLGRFDRYLAPFYERDKASDRINIESAADIVEAFFLKLASNPRTFQNLTVGGYDSQNGYCCNDLTHIVLKTCLKLHKDQPLLTLRWHPSMPADLWEDILNLINTGSGFPALFNDEICIKAKQRCGISNQDAEQYAIVGCVELSASGREYSHTEGLRINWLKVLELMLNHGQCLISGEKFILAEPMDLETIHRFDDFYAWFKRELRHFTTTAIRAANILDGNIPHHWPSPFLSATMDNCIQSGLDVTAGGTIYNNSAINAAGMANVVDSLLAIRKYVFETRAYTLSEMAAMLKRNFAGNEPAGRMVFHQCARFGSDVEAAQMMADLTSYFHSLVIVCSNPRGGNWEMGFYSVDSHAWLGERTGASPDGRRKGYSLANGISPVQGTEKYGPTETIHAVVTPDHTCFGNGMVLDLKFHPHFFTPSAHRQSFRHMIETYFDMGGMEIQFNVVDRQTLLDAQSHPEQYRDLIVRVSGFSAYFTTLRTSVQNEIIDRTEFNNI
jgi:formate C-acetyltransferase